MNARVRVHAVVAWALGACCAVPLFWPLGISYWADPVNAVVWFVPPYMASGACFGVLGRKVWVGWRGFVGDSPRWVQPTSAGWRVKLEPSARWLVGLAGLLILGGCVFVVGLFSISSPTFLPQWWVAGVMWLVGLIPLAVLCWRTPPDRWLEVDEQAEELRWIHCRTGDHFVIPFEQVVEIRVDDSRHYKPLTGRSMWFVMVVWQDGRWRQVTELSRWVELQPILNRQAESSADALADWLHERLGLGEGPHPPSPSPERRGGVQDGDAAGSSANGS